MKLVRILENSSYKDRFNELDILGLKKTEGNVCACTLQKPDKLSEEGKYFSAAPEGNTRS